MKKIGCIHHLNQTLLNIHHDMCRNDMHSAMIPNVFCQPKQINLEFSNARVAPVVIVLEVQHM